MNLLHAGILLPEDLLNSTWFQVFAGFVAFNTVVYMGLTLSKMMVWPRQATLRRLASRLPGGPRRRDAAEVALVAAAVDDHGGPDTPAPPAAPEPGPSGSVPEAPTNLRGALLAHDVPISLAFMGGLLLTLNIVIFVAEPSGSAVTHVVGIALGVVLLAIAQVVSRAHVGPTTLAVIWCMATVAIGVFLASPLVDDHATLALAFLLVITAAYGFALVSWTPFAVTGVLLLAGTTYQAYASDQAEPLGWTLVALAALGVGALLVRTHMSAIDALEEAQRLSQRLATTDPLTGLLSHAGMESMLPRFVGTARRAGESICVMFVAVPELQRAIAEYGRDYGDAVLVAAGGAVRDAVRDGDLVARWRDDAFLVAGFGLQPDSGMLRRRIQSQVVATGVDLGKWPVVVEAGAAAGPADEADITVLIQRAEDDAAKGDEQSAMAAGTP